MRLKRVGVLSVGMTFGAIYAIFGLIFGVFFALFATLAGGLASLAEDEAAEGGRLFGLLFGVGAVFFLPIFYGILGFLGGLLMGALYNLMSKLTGGIELTLE